MLYFAIAMKCDIKIENNIHLIMPIKIHNQSTKFTLKINNVKFATK
jgi:hypothetical protein